MSQTKKGNRGCLWLFVLGLLSAFSFVIIKAVFQFSSGISGFLAVFVSVLFLKIVLGGTSFKNLLRSGIIVFIILIGFQFVVRFLLNILVKKVKTKFLLLQKKRSEKLQKYKKSTP